MSILIKGMEMPKEKEIFLRIDEKGEIYVYGAYPTELHKAVPVQPHGRLIDANATDIYRREERVYVDIENSPFSEYLEGVKDGLHEAAKCLSTAPTIIPADPQEEGET